jgi:hypothetical protein
MNANEAAERDELKLAWQALERRLERTQLLELATFRRARLIDVRRALRPLVAGQLAQALLGGLMIVWFALFWVEHRGAPAMVALGALGQLWAAALTALAVRELVLVARLDYGAPVLTLQRRIAELRARRLRVAPFTIVSGCAMWLPVTLVVFAQLDGAARWGEELPGMVAWLAWAEQPQALVWLLANVVLVPLLAWFALGRLRDPRRVSLAKRVDDEIAGRSVVRVESMLAEIAEFEKD